MNPIRTLFLAIMIIGACCQADSTAPLPDLAKWTPPIQLNDQHERPVRLGFPQTNTIVLTIADRHGSKQLTDWIAPLQKKHGERIYFVGIAELKGVPPFLRGLLRRSFRNQCPYPVMLDWTGNTCKKFPVKAKEANVFIIHPKGKILNHFTGKASASKLLQANAAIAQVNP